MQISQSDKGWGVEKVENLIKWKCLYNEQSKKAWDQAWQPRAGDLNVHDAKAPVNSVFELGQEVVNNNISRRIKNRFEAELSLTEKWS